MITMDLREAIQLQSVYGPATGAYALVADLGQARDSVLAFLCAPLPACNCRRYVGLHLLGCPAGRNDAVVYIEGCGSPRPIVKPAEGSR